MQIDFKQLRELVASDKVERLMLIISEKKCVKSNYSNDDILLNRGDRIIGTDKHPCYIGYFHAYARYLKKRSTTTIYYVVLKEAANEDRQISIDRADQTGEG